MVRTDRIRLLLKEKGLKVSAFCSQIGVYRTYFSEVDRGNTTVPEDKLALIADILETTVEYLTGRTDKKEKPIQEPVRQDELPPDIRRVIDLFLQLPEDRQGLAVDLLESALERLKKP